ncbi:MAG: hypothetical protein GQ553_00535 [Nitrosomonadaceae bacterium]|nr:hypothetical protein [Nitrosomonadaceae bacterium]
MADNIPEHKSTMTPKTSTWKKPEKAKGGPPRAIGYGMGSPGGPQTPGAKLERQKAQAGALRASKKKKAAVSSTSSSVGGGT